MSVATTKTFKYIQLNFYGDQMMNSLIAMAAILFAFSTARAENVLEYFYVFSGTTDLSQAKIILIGERHTVPSDEDMVIQVINQYSQKISDENANQEPDILLAEGSSSQKLDTTATRMDGQSLGGQMRIVGWDDDTLFFDQKRAFKRLSACSSILVDPTASKGAKDFAMIRGKYWGQKVNQIGRERNMAMLRTIKLQLAEHPRSKIFVMAGQAHFLDGQRIIDFLKKSGQKYSILIPNPNDPHRHPSEDDLHYLSRLVGRLDGENLSCD